VDLAFCEAVLIEAQAWGLNPQDNHEELMEHVELHRCLEEVKVEHVTEARQLTVPMKGHL
jgi:hypothetical protein